MMCYRCRICDDVVPHGTPLLRHTTYRIIANGFGNPQQQIAQEFPICTVCKDKLDMSACPRKLQLAYNPELQKNEPAPKEPVVIKLPAYKPVALGRAKPATK